MISPAKPNVKKEVKYSESPKHHRYSRLSPTSEKKYVDYREVYHDMNLAIEGFEQKMEKQIVSNDVDFMMAYRNHMIQVQRDLEDLRKKTNQCEFIIKKDEKVCKL